jgi:hypothetical protein
MRAKEIMVASPQLHLGVQKSAEGVEKVIWLQHLQHAQQKTQTSLALLCYSAASMLASYSVALLNAKNTSHKRRSKGYA